MLPSVCIHGFCYFFSVLSFRSNFNFLHRRLGVWGQPGNHRWVRCEWVRETMLFLSLGRAAPTCAPAAAPSLVFPCVLPSEMHLGRFHLVKHKGKCESRDSRESKESRESRESRASRKSNENPMWALSPTPNPPYQPQAGLIGINHHFFMSENMKISSSIF